MPCRPNTVQVIHITDVINWEVLKVEGVANTSVPVAVGFQPEGHRAWETLLEHALRARRDFNRWELLQSLKALADGAEHDDLDRGTKRDLLHKLIDMVLPADERDETKGTIR